MGRLVKTHSTYIEGLIPLLVRLAEDEHIKTVTPGVITRTKSVANKLVFRVSREIECGFKVNARKGRSAQEVYIITTYKKHELEKQLGI